VSDNIEELHDGHMTKRIEEEHAGTWHKIAGLSGSISLVLPILSEFEGIGEEVMMGIGGTGLVAVFGVLLKIGKVTSAVHDIAEEQDEIHVQMDEQERQRKTELRIRKKDSPYQSDPIGWCESERGIDHEKF
tara:strand:- start:2725 stop:3120 length:396 start_codon:yes stop_codon:yes gene_type:complete